MQLDTEKLVTSRKLLELLFAPDCRPSLRSLKRWKTARIIPHYKIGHRVYYDPDKVREKLAKKNYIRDI
jgi:hypothetical protein